MNSQSRYSIKDAIIILVSLARPSLAGRGSGEIAIYVYVLVIFSRATMLSIPLVILPKAIAQPGVP